MAAEPAAATVEARSAAGLGGGALATLALPMGNQHRTLPILLLAGLAGCPSDGTPSGVRLGEITAKDVSPVTRDARWEKPDQPGAAAIVSHPTEDELEKSVSLSDKCRALENPTYTSKLGLSPITLTTSKQELLATFAENRYEITGLIPESAYDTDDEELEVSHEETGASITVPAPSAIGDPNEVIGEPEGLATEVRVTDGSFTTVVVFVSATDGSTTLDITCEFDHDDMRVEAGVRVTAMVESDARDRIESMGMTPTQVIVSIDNQVMSDEFFPDEEPIPIRAGRALDINAADLGGGSSSDECSFPTIIPIGSSEVGKLCFDQGLSVANCSVSPDMCGEFQTSFDFHLTGEGDRFLTTGVGLQLTTSSHGTVSTETGRVDDLPEATDITVTASDFSGVVHTVVFRYDGAQVTVQSLTKGVAPSAAGSRVDRWVAAPAVL